MAANCAVALCNVYAILYKLRSHLRSSGFGKVLDPVVDRCLYLESIQFCWVRQAGLKWTVLSLHSLVVGYGTRN